MGVFSGLLEHHAEESRCQDATLLHAIGDEQGVRKVAIESDLATLIFVQLHHHLEELWGGGAADVLQDLPRSFPAHCVECFCQVDKRCIDSLVLLTALFLELSENKHHVHCAYVGSEATLALWKVVFDDRWYKPFDWNSGKDFASDGQKGDPPVIGAVRFFSIVLVQGDEDCMASSGSLPCSQQ